MKLKVLLWYMARRMELLSRTHTEFIAKLHGRDFVLQISSAQGTHRFFHVHHNRVQSRSAVHERPDLTLQFASDEVGLRLLTRGDANGFMAAVQQQEVTVSGDYALLMWFMSIGKYLRPGRRWRLGKAAKAAGPTPTSG